MSVKRKYLNIAILICFWGAFVLLFLFVGRYENYLIDSDMSSEIILGKVLSDEGAIISKNWYYSSELKVLSTPLLISILFHFFHNWATIRLMACAISWLIMLLCYYYMLSQIGMKKYFAVSAIFLLIPISDGYFKFVLFTLMYIPFVYSSFLAFALLFHFVKSSGWQKFVLWILLCILALVSGVGGIRLVVTLYLPMFIATVWFFFLKRKVEYLVAGITGVVLSGVGYFINLGVLSNAFSFATWNDIRLGGGIHWDSISAYIFGFFRFFGYSYGERKTPILSGFSCLAVAVMVFFVAKGLWSHLREKELEDLWLIELFVVCGTIIMGGVYAFTDMSYSDRYSMSIMVFTVLPVIVGLDELSRKQMKGIHLLEMVLLLGIFLGCIYRYSIMMHTDRTKEFRQIVDYLTNEEKIDTGYATYWNGNILTELSNGFLDIYCLKPKAEEITDIDTLYQSLQVKEHEVHKPEGRIFLLLTNEESEICPLGRFLEEEAAVFYTENYKMYVFESYEDIKSKLQ